MKKNQKKEIAIPSSIHCISPVSVRHGREVYADNPFLESFAIQIQRKSMTVAAGLSIKDDKGDNISAGTVAMYREVDVEEFLKIYVKNVKILFDLSASAQKTLIPLMRVIQKNAKDIAHIFFSYRDAQDACIELDLKPISKATYHRGIKDLISVNFLAVHINGPFWYWINPNILFNGDRVRFIKEYKITRKKEALEQASLI